jgi:hypothetical protein
MLSLFRTLVFSHRLDKLEPGQGFFNHRIHAIIAEEPLDFLAWAEEVVPADILKSTWYSTFRHRLFILIGSILSCETLKNEPTSLVPYQIDEQTLNWPLSQVFLFGRKHIAESGVEGERFIRETFLPRMMEMLGLGHRVAS